MNWADYAIIAIVGISVLVSVIRGFVREAMSLLVWLAALGLASVYYQVLAEWLTALIGSPSMRLIVAWAGIFVVILLLGGILSYLLAKLLKATGLSGTDRLLGMIFGTARGGLVVLALLIMIPAIIPLDQESWWRESRLIPEFLKFEAWARDAAMVVMDFFRQMFQRI